MIANELDGHPFSDLERTRLETAIEHSAESIMITDHEGTIQYVNPAFEQITSFSRGEAVGQNPRILKSGAAADAFYRKLWATLKNGEVWKGQFTNKRKDGTRYQLEATISPVKDPDGRIINYVLVGRDVTRTNGLEDQLRQAQKMEAIGTLAGGIAHDFNNLLMGIQGNAFLALMDIQPDHPVYKYLKTIEEYTRSGANLTSQLLSLGRGSEYKKQATDINQVIAGVAEMFNRTRKEITIHKKLAEEIFSVEIDTGQIEQVLLNLFINSWQAMPQGGHLRLETKNVILYEDFAGIYHVPPGDYVKIAITDTGMGMDKAVQRRIFDPFFTTKAKERGTGLGLSTAYGIIQNHGGIINVASEKGKGTTFNIYLPISRKAVENAGVSEQAISYGSETILLVDDEEMVLGAEKQILERLGYRVILARNGKEAVEVYAQARDQIDLVILDMIMPDMGGVETCEQLEIMDPDITVLMISGCLQSDPNGSQLGKVVKGFINKPFDVVHLSQTLRTILDKP